MMRSMHFKVRRSREFRDTVVNYYRAEKTCYKTAVKISERFGFNVSEGYISRILKEEGFVITKNGHRTYSIYDAQLGRL